MSEAQAPEVIDQEPEPTAPATLPAYNLVSQQSMLALAGQLARVVKERKLSANISGKEYVLVEGWQFAGGSLGLTAIVESIEDLSAREDDGEIKYKATVSIQRLNDGAVVSRGVALCSNKERSKRNFDEYAILSMAQTRAVAKAYRNLLAWLMKAAGFEGTPAEEMIGESVDAIDADRPEKSDPSVLWREIVRQSKQLFGAEDWQERLKQFCAEQLEMDSVDKDNSEHLARVLTGLAKVDVVEKSDGQSTSAETTDQIEALAKEAYGEDHWHDGLDQVLAAEYGGKTLNQLTVPQSAKLMAALRKMVKK